MIECSTLAAALVVGAALALSGAALQSVLGNPLAEPYMLGLVGGASLFATAAYHFGLVALGACVLPLSAFLGACASLALVCAIAALAARRRARRGFDPETVVLAGFVTGSITGSLQMVLLSYAEPATFAQLSQWLFGNLRAVRPAALAAGAAAALAAALALQSQCRSLNALVLGEDVARALGVRVARTQLVALLAASLATAASVSIAGAIGFVGLVVPHVARRLAGANHRVLLPACALGGALALVAAEAAARLFPGTVSAGVVCAICGGPFFLYLLCSRRGAA